MTIAEPITSLTDLIVALLCFYYYGIFKKNNPNQTAYEWPYFFLFLGIATSMGAINHAFLTNHEQITYRMMWLDMQLVSGLTSWCAVIATVRTFITNSDLISSIKKWSFFYLFFYVVAVLYFQDFKVVVINNVICLIPVMLIHFFHPRRRPEHKWIALGLLVNCGAAVVFATKFTIHPVWCTHNDLAHVIIGCGVWVTSLTLDLPNPPKEGIRDLPNPPKEGTRR